MIFLLFIFEKAEFWTEYLIYIGQLDLFTYLLKIAEINCVNGFAMLHVRYGIKPQGNFQCDF